jgi:hypothetical protein
MDIQNQSQNHPRYNPLLGRNEKSAGLRARYSQRRMFQLQVQ